jgi:glucose-1-phosphate cytidylyltransferase
MKVVILAGGLPSTISEEDEKIPKPMAEIGGRPILWHIMKQFDYYGFQDFIICVGYKGEIIKQYFMDYYIYQSDITVDLQKNEVKIHRKKTENWNVAVIDTGQNTSIMERINRIKDYVGQEPFLVTYGDCVSNIDIAKMVIYHKENKKYATIAVAHPTGRNEILSIDNRNELLLENKSYMERDAWVNACTMVFDPRVFAFMDKRQNFLEKGLFEILSQKGEIITYKHDGFWSPMETKRDHSVLENMWKEENAPWKVWEEN